MRAIRSLENWTFTEIGGGLGTKDNEWIPVSQFPTTVHVELLHLKRIPDPFIGLHEWDVQWVGESRWAFKTTFPLLDTEVQTKNLDLVFHGLDTFATVHLNGNKILESSNQFVAHRVSIKDRAVVGSNDLTITFESSFRKGREIEKVHGKLNLWNGDSSRLHVRKAQYNYGWDWGPILMTVGPWKPIHLEIYENRITDLDIRSEISEDLNVSLKAAVDTLHDDGYIKVLLRGPQGEVKATADRVQLDKGFSFSFEAGQLELWYPVGYGKQPIYTLHIDLITKDGTLIDTVAQKVAFRRCEIVQESLAGEEGLSFLFEINNIRIFCGGSNWIPADSFLTTVTADRYRKWLELLVQGNQNMIRVWGGGIYEDDIFYDICDELGILVWQDFMFGCGQYPAYDAFLELVEEEAKQNVRRLRHHPSVVIFAGNNEDYQIAESLNLELDYSDEESDYRKTSFPARHIYERVLPKIVGELSNIFYHRGSPYSGHGKVTTDRTFGDIHQWNVWHGSQEPWHNWDILSGRFVSEFGMQGYPDIRTIDYWLGGETAERFPQSRVNNNHNKAAGFERRLELYLVENFRHSFDMESYVYHTQIMQAETLASAYRLWRRNWKGRGKEYTSGALVWQINDCWPVTSWAIVDYFLRPKPAYFTISRELASFTVGMARKDKQCFKDDLSAADFTIETTLEIWGTNSTLQTKIATLEVSAFDLHSNNVESWTQSVILDANSSTEFWAGTLPGQPIRTSLSQVKKDIIVSSRLLDTDGTVLARYSNWPEPFKYIHFPSVEKVALKVELSADGESVILSSGKPIKGIILDVDGDEVKWSDQAIDLVPGDPQIVKALGLKGRPVKARYLGLDN